MRTMFFLRCLVGSVLLMRVSDSVLSALALQVKRVTSSDFILCFAGYRRSIPQNSSNCYESRLMHICWHPARCRLAQRAVYVKRYSSSPNPVSNFSRASSAPAAPRVGARRTVPTSVPAKHRGRPARGIAVAVLERRTPMLTQAKRVKMKKEHYV